MNMIYFSSINKKKLVDTRKQFKRNNEELLRDEYEFDYEEWIIFFENVGFEWFLNDFEKTFS